MDKQETTNVYLTVSKDVMDKVRDVAKDNRLSLSKTVEELLKYGIKNSNLTLTFNSEKESEDYK